MVRLMCEYAPTLSLFMFLAAFVPYSVLLYLLKLDATFIQKRYQFLLSWNELFSLKIIFVIKVSQNAFNFNQIES